MSFFTNGVLAHRISIYFYGMFIPFYQRKILFMHTFEHPCYLQLLLRFKLSNHLTGSNFPCCKNAMELCLAFNEFDYALMNDKLVGIICWCQGE
jgi:hypothetical protein